jgi:hypothetical protein
MQTVFYPPPSALLSCKMNVVRKERFDDEGIRMRVNSIKLSDFS